MPARNTNEIAREFYNLRSKKSEPASVETSKSESEPAFVETFKSESEPASVETSKSESEQSTGPSVGLIISLVLVGVIVACLVVGLYVWFATTKSRHSGGMQRSVQLQTIENGV
jgi:cobalamin biosynthesis Mg chelatase CobN